MNARMRAGLWAGFITVIGTTLFLLAGRAIGFLPPILDIRVMAVYVDPVVYPSLAAGAGLINHIAAGSAIGLVYGWLAPRFSVPTGIATLMVVWLMVMLIGLPLTGRGLFGLRQGPTLMIWTVALYIIFGAVMGVIARIRVSKSNQ